MQSAFVDIGLERDAFLYITDFMEEQGDAADFDAESARNGRGEGRARGEGKERSEGRDRGEGRRRDRPAASVAAPEEGETITLQGESEGLDTAEETGDGSRRWRGRRGRRRGRGGENGERPEGGSHAEAGTENAGSEASEPREAREPRESRDLDRGSDRGADRGSDRPRRGERDRGRQDAVRDRFAPRGHRHTASEESIDVNASAEPFILPGESLSKYRRGAGSEPTARESRGGAETISAPKPSTEFELTSAWDGGLTLPGESLSRQRGGESKRAEPKASEAADSYSSASVHGRDRRRERDERSGRPARGRNRSLSPEEAVLPGVTSQHEPEPASQPFSDDVPAFEVAETEARLDLEHFAAQDVEYTPATDVAPAEETPRASVVELVEEFHETVAEYEPGEEASASYRIDPAGPSEFRQSSTIDESIEPVDAEGVAEARFDETRGFASDNAHEFTNVQPTGEMISEWPLTPENATAAESEPGAPIEHETAVQSVDLAHAEPSPADPRSFETSSPQSFAPGQGQLEEELIDDEESDLPVLHAGANDDYEEETLENAADLGTMIREMSIDQITRPELPELDDDEDDDDDFDIAEEEMEEDELEADGPIAASDIDEIEEEHAAEEEEFDDAGATEAPETQGEGETTTEREPGRRFRRGDTRRRGRERGGERRGGGHSRNGGRSGRHSMQTTDLPAISDLLKPGQEVLVQIAKEPIAKKGARITSHIALPGRFLVFMPTVNHVGVSRKIESDSERRRLKEILLNEKGEASGGFIVRTAASGASEEELRSDLRFLLNLWADIKQRSDSSKSPALIYHDLNLVERILRDQVTDNFSAIWVDTETEYERVLRFLQRFQPSLIRRVKLYSKETPLFEQFGLQEEINKALRSKVWLKSGGSIVINQTEALVAIDINTGKYVGKTARLEDTIVKTNLDAIPEIVRQIRLRDLGGIIVIDFIDMDERKNRQKVLIALEEELKKDRAPSKVLQFNDFGLVAITRKRVKQSLERTLSTTCSICTGTGMVKSPVTVCNEIFVELRKMHRHLEKGDIMLRVNPEVVKQLKSAGGKWLQEMEEMSGKTILVKSDPSLHPEQFDIH
jgi:ribonuclease G